MKRTVTALVFMLIAVFAFNGCGNDPTKPLSDVFADIKSQVSINDMNEFTAASSLERYYGIAEADVSEFAGGINNSGVDQEEIVLIKASDKDAADRIKTALDNRYNAKLNENINYNPEQAEIIKECSVEANGLYVSMIVSENADKITEIYKSDLGI